MKQVIQSVIEKEKECAAKLEKAKQESHQAVQQAEKNFKEQVEQVRLEEERRHNETIRQAEIQIDKEQAEILRQASLSFNAIDTGRQEALARKVLAILIES
jgi:vacuolar-type H+-ATPase subunit H